MTIDPDPDTREQLEQIADACGVSLEDLATFAHERFLNDVMRPVRDLVSASEAPQRH